MLVSRYPDPEYIDLDLGFLMRTTFTKSSWVHLPQCSAHGFIFSYRQTMVTGMQELDRMKSQVHDVQVPLDVFE